MSLSARYAPARYATVRYAPVRHRSLFVLGYDLGKAGILRLIFNTIPHRHFEIRKYSFPAGKPLKLRGVGRNHFKPLTTKERDVLTTPTNDVTGIIEYFSYFRGIYNHDRKRVVINIRSGEVFAFTSELAN